MNKLDIHTGETSSNLISSISILEKPAQTSSKLSISILEKPAQTSSVVYPYWRNQFKSHQ